MNIWILSGWDTFYGDWVIASVLFHASAIAPKVKKLLDECPEFNQVKVETWFREGYDDDASFYEEEIFYRDDQ